MCLAHFGPKIKTYKKQNALACIYIYLVGVLCHLVVKICACLVFNFEYVHLWSFFCISMTV